MTEEEKRDFIRRVSEKLNHAINDLVWVADTLEESGMANKGSLLRKMAYKVIDIRDRINKS